MTQTTDSLPSTTDVDPDADLQRVQPDLVGTQTERLADDPDRTARYPGIPFRIRRFLGKDICI